MRREINYATIIKSQLGPKKGILTIVEEENKIVANYVFLGQESKMTGKRIGRKLLLFGNLITPLGTCDCIIHGVENNVGIKGAIKIGDKNYVLYGVKI